MVGNEEGRIVLFLLGKRRYNFRIFEFFKIYKSTNFFFFNFCSILNNSYSNDYKFNRLLTANFDGACVDSLASQIRGFAHISAGIFRISVKNIESHITKIVSFAEAMPCLYSNSIHEPLIVKSFRFY